MDEQKMPRRARRSSIPSVVMRIPPSAITITDFAENATAIYVRGRSDSTTAVMSSSAGAPARSSAASSRGELPV